MHKTIKRDNDSIVDQDAAIMDYLSGLLTEEGEGEAPSSRPARSANRTVNLAVVDSRASESSADSEQLQPAIDETLPGSVEPQMTPAESIDLAQTDAQTDTDTASSLPSESESAALAEPETTQSLDDAEAVEEQDSELAEEQMSHISSEQPVSEQPVAVSEHDPVDAVLAEDELTAQPAEQVDEPLDQLEDQAAADADPELAESAASDPESAIDDAAVEPADPEVGDDAAASESDLSKTAEVDEQPTHEPSEDEAALAALVETELEEQPVDETPEDTHEPQSAELADQDGALQQAEVEDESARPEATVDAEDEAIAGSDQAEDVTEPEQAADALFDQAEADDNAAPEQDEAAGDFETVFVGKMQFLLPTDQVNTAFELTQMPEPVGGAPEFIAGKIEHQDRAVLLIDLAKLTGIKPHSNTPRKVVLLGRQGLWGVVAEQPQDPRAIDAEQIAWRDDAERAQRRVWLAGTVNTAQTAVLDIDGLKASLRAR